MKKYVLLGLLMLLSAGHVFAEEAVDTAKVQPVTIPLANPLAEKQVVLDKDVKIIDEIQLADLRPEAKIDSTEISKVSEVANKEQTVKKVETENLKEVTKAPQTEEIKQTEEMTENINTEITQSQQENQGENGDVQEEINPEDVIELDIGKEDLFVPKTERKEIPEEKIDRPNDEKYKLLPQNLRTETPQDEHMMKTNAFVEDKSFNKITTEAFENSAKGEYKLNPELSIKNLSGNETNNKVSTNLAPLKSTDDDINTSKLAPTKLPATNPRHSQINFNSSVFRF